MTETSSTSDDGDRPKSKKELRALKKAAAKKEATADAEDESSAADHAAKPPTKEEQRAERMRLKKERRKEAKMEMIRDERRERKVRQQKRRRREENAPKKLRSKQQQRQQQEVGDAADGTRANKKQRTAAQSSQKGSVSEDKPSVEVSVLCEILHGTKDEATGMTTLQKGVQYKDLLVGKGASAQEGMLVQVRYKLTSRGFRGVTLDSSKDFKFRLGKGEVIQAWDISVVGMREGGRRQLVVPPAAGYGSQDIGAGPGATLYFDITLLSVRGR